MELTLEQQIGQMLWFGWQGETAAESLTLSAHARALLDEFHAGGVILMGRNVRDPSQVAFLSGELQFRSETPLLIGIDQEGGAVVRMPLPGLTFAGNMALGAAGDPALVTAVSHAIGEQLAAMGINVNFAPVLDVNNNPQNPIIGVRSFGEDPARVAELGLAALQGYAGTRVLPCVKHFPGHGDTDVDSHLDLPVQTAPRSRLDAVELAPFRAAVQAKTPLLMSAHIRFTALDERLPATLSRPVLTGLLREEMGYKGVVVTDCLEMHGIAHHFGIEEAALAAVEAGADCLLACHTQETQRRIYSALVSAVREGRLRQDRIEQSVQRILRLKADVGLSERHVADPEHAAALVSAPRFQELEQTVARRAVTVVRDQHGWLPLRSGPLVVTGPERVATALVQALEEAGLPSQVRPLHSIRPPSGETVLLLVVAGDPSVTEGPERARTWQDEGSRVIVTAVREPYPLRRFQEFPCLLATYGSSGGLLAALAEVLSGKATATGRLPVTLV